MPKIGQAIEKIINKSSKALGELQVAINVVLWGRGNAQPKQTAKLDTTTGNLNYTTTPTKALPPDKKNNLLQSGLFNVLDVIAQADLCNILNYLTTNVQIKKKPRPPKSEWNQTQRLLYGLQDASAEIVKYIDKYTAYPNTLIGSYTGLGPNGLTIEEALGTLPKDTTNLSGFQTAKYNTYYLLQSIKDVLGGGSASQNSLFTAEDRALLAQVPGLSSNLNLLDDFIGRANQYTDYRNIPNTDLQKIQNKIAVLRSICITVQSLDIGSATAIVGNFIGTDIRSQIQKLSKYVDPTKLIPTLRSINASIQSFIRMAQRAQAILKTAQFIVKILVLLVKVFNFLIRFFKKLPLPNIYTTSGVQTTLTSTTESAKDQVDSVTMALKEINALLEVLLGFIRYVLANTNELLIRLQAILAALEGCDATKDSDVVTELTKTATQLSTLKDQLEAYIIAYDSKSNPDTARFGQYDIRVVDEQVTDTTIVNKRRRGIALDVNNAIVAQSDLTFATNTTVIIEEVKLKLVSTGLVQSSLGTLTAEQASIIASSLDFLDNNDIVLDDLSAPDVELDPPDNEDENIGLGLNAFVNKLKGGRRLRRRTRKALAQASAQLATQLAGEKVSARNSIASSTINRTAGNSNQQLNNYEVKVYERVLPGTNPNLAATTKILIRTVQVRAASITQATEEAKDIVDESRARPQWIYEVKQIP